jgi:hypothetical protein
MILLFKNGAAAGAQQVLGNRRRRRALGRAQTRAAKSCGVRGSHFPALFDYFNLERKLVLAAFFLRVLTTMLYSTWSFSFYTELPTK